MDDIVEVVVETPRDSRNVYQVDHQGQVRFDRRLPGSFAYPADYGYIVGAAGFDGEPLDALVLMPEPTYPGYASSGSGRGDLLDHDRARPRGQADLRARW